MCYSDDAVSLALSKAGVAPELGGKVLDILENETEAELIAWAQANPA